MAPEVSNRGARPRGIGLWRASESYLARLGPLPWLWAVYGAVFASLIFSLVSAGTAVQTLVLAPQGPGMAEQLARERQSRYRFTASADGQTLRLEGTFELAITRNFTTFLARYPGAQQLILESPGGNIHEARGIASLVRERSLETRVEGSCSSACTIAFVAGKRRSMAPGARFGFHQYRLEADYQVLFASTAARQHEDGKLFEEMGVEASFTRRAFRTPADQMWFPAARLLLGSGFVHMIASPPAGAR